MDDVRTPTPEPAGENPDQRFSRRLRTRPKPGLSPEAKAWMEENREAIDEFNAWYEENGSPLDQYRTF